MMDDALVGRSPDGLSTLMVDLDDLRTRCPDVPAETFAKIEAARTERPVSECETFTDWSKLVRDVPNFPLSRGLNVGNRVCDEHWEDCEGVTRMCKSEMFYVVPDSDPVQGYKVNVNSVLKVGDEYRMLRPPRCMQKNYD